jgi:hypothetical protein
MLAITVAAGTAANVADRSSAAPKAGGAASHRLTLKPGHHYGDRYQNGVLPVGDGKYKDDHAKQGYYDACPTYVNALENGGGGAFTRGPWFIHHNKDYKLSKKVHVHGNVKWHSSFSIKTKGGKRVIHSNGLPSHRTGVYPVRSSDPAYNYDRNPNSITSQNISMSLTTSPTYGAPQCGGGEVGIMTTGVMLFNGFDAGGRDAGAWEVQDKCDAHPEMTGVYHYHTLSGCIKNPSVHHVIGWAFDGFPITGPYLSKHNVLTTRDLDVCHGITSTVKINGKSVRTYHYVMTQDFPYSVSCFRATPFTIGPVPTP